MSAVGALIGFGGQVANYFAQNHQADKAFEKNKELAQMQNQYNIDQWNRENAFNSPMAQMNRFKNAGLNPNLIYGQQNLAANSPELVGGTSYQSPNANVFDAQAVAQLDLLNAQRENIEADTANKQADTSNKEEQNVLMQTQEDLNKSMSALNEEEAKKVKAEIPLIQTQVKKTFQEYLKLKVDTSRANEFYDAQIKKLEADAGLSNAQARDIINTYKARVNLLLAQAEREGWEASRLEKECMLLGEQYVQATYATKIAEASAAVEGSKGYQWTSKSIGLLSDAVGAVGGIMLGFGALKGVGALRGYNSTRAAVRSGYATNGVGTAGSRYHF